MTTNGAPAINGKANGAVSLIEKEMRNNGIERQLVRTHCIIHLEALCAKSIKMQVMRVDIKLVNFVRARGLYHRQFQQLLEEMDNTGLQEKIISIHKLSYYKILVQFSVLRLKNTSIYGHHVRIL